jgi:hypothetical protein
MLFAAHARQQLGAAHSISVLCDDRGDQQLIAPITRASVLSRSTTVAGEPTNWVSTRLATT